MTPRLQRDIELVGLARAFFDIRNLRANCQALGLPVSVPTSGAPKPLSVMDFSEYLGLKGERHDQLHVVRVVRRMGEAGMLLDVGQYPNMIAGLGRMYLSVGVAGSELSSMAAVLGGEYLYHTWAPGIVHVLGLSDDGDERGGTGIVVDGRHVLTCRHVVDRMEVRDRQRFQGCEQRVTGIKIADGVDVAVVELDGAPLTPTTDVAFRRPAVTETVYTLGYPKLAGIREAALVIQRGAVTNDAVRSLTDEHLFLYSAIARPGNSGGPVLSEDGRVVGIAVSDSSGEYQEGTTTSPYYAGIPAQVVVDAFNALGGGVQLRLVDV